MSAGASMLPFLGPGLLEGRVLEDLLAELIVPAPDPLLEGSRTYGPPESYIHQRDADRARRMTAEMYARGETERIFPDPVYTVDRRFTLGRNPSMPLRCAPQHYLDICLHRLIEEDLIMGGAPCWQRWQSIRITAHGVALGPDHELRFFGPALFPEETVDALSDADIARGFARALVAHSDFLDRAMEDGFATRVRMDKEMMPTPRESVDLPESMD